MVELFEVFSSIEQEESSPFLGVLNFVVNSLLVVYKALLSVEFEHSIWVCDKDVDIGEGRVFSHW